MWPAFAPLTSHCCAATAAMQHRVWISATGRALHLLYFVTFVLLPARLRPRPQQAQRAGCRTALCCRPLMSAFDPLRTLGLSLSWLDGMVQEEQGRESRKLARVPRLRFNESTALCEWRLISRGRACNGPPLDAPGTPLNLTAHKPCLHSFIWEQGWPEQSAAPGRSRAGCMTQSVLRNG